jgi:AcrR family transcriptional regulator
MHVFTKDASASLESIARVAGVGVATLYRHYPTREALLEATFRSEIQQLCDAAPALLQQHSPDIAFAHFLAHLIEGMTEKRWMVEALRAALTGTDINESRAMMAAAVAPIVEAGKAERVLRDDITVDDFIVAEGAIAMVAPEIARRLAVLLVDGLRNRTAPSQRGAGRRQPTE